MEKLRIDQLLVDQHYADNRSRAKDLIRQGLVTYNQKLVTKAGQIVSDPSLLKVTISEQFVSRGAKKLQIAIENFKIQPHNLVIADIGASTGGFTDYLLTKEPQKIYAIDVGHDQLASKLRQDPRVVNLEGQDIRLLKSLPEPVDLAVVDLSYISLRLTLPSVINLLKPHHQIIALFKPQFEVGRENLQKNGLVKNPQITIDHLNDFIEWCSFQGWKVKKSLPSKIKGKTGNQEYLLLIST